MKQQKNIKKDLKKLQTNKRFLAILILLFISILFWITISLIGSQSKEEVSAELTLLAKPLTPNIDKETLSEIEAKYSYSEQELFSFTIYKILTTRDGKTERVVPLEVTINDIDPKPTTKPKGFGSLLQTELSEPESENDKSGENEITKPPSTPLVEPPLIPLTK